MMLNSVTINNRGDHLNSIDRKQKILSYLQENGSIIIEDLVSVLGVSSMTIRRDLRKLSAQGLVSLERGGAVLNSGSLFEYNMQLKQKVHIPEKQGIAQKSLDYISEGDSIFLDAGTTVAEVAKLLQNKKNIVVITHSLLVANHLSASSNIRIIMCPGEYRATSMAYMGPLTDEFVTQFKIDTLFLGVEGVDLKNGLTVPDLLDGITKKALINKAEKVICVADSSKFGQSFLYKISPLSHIDMIITDDDLPKDMMEQYLQHEIRLICAPFQKTEQS